MDYKHIHFIGIGGIGMSGIASILRDNRGVTVSGSDIKNSHLLDSLRERGINVFLGHRPENIAGADLVVYSSAISSDNAEFAEAKRRNIALIKRAECLAELMKDKAAITISGSHGKTTTTSLVTHMLIQAGFAPTAAIGGIVKNWNNNIYLGESRYFVAEADESDGTFLKYEPLYSILTNIDYEHLDYYKDYASIIKVFRQFMEKTKEGGCLIACADDFNIKRILADFRKPFITFGLNKGCDVSASKIEQNGFVSKFDCLYRDKFLGRFTLSIPGIHNISNSLAVIALGQKLGIDEETIHKSLLTYKGAERRLEIKGESREYLIIDDYAHHPTEIKATLDAARKIAEHKSYKRIIAVFQPHRFSRTKFLLDEFSESFEQADYLIITDIYAASEVPIAGVNAGNLYDKIKQKGKKNIEFVKREDIVIRVLDIATSGDLIITLGAGDIGKLTDELSFRLVRKN
ncbi:MAG: UDP-N-acetylmuramate--L-alanine ligase [Candidatus Omnitrophota bacterium]